MIGPQGGHSGCLWGKRIHCARASQLWRDGQARDAPANFYAPLSAEFTADCGSTKMSLIEIGAPRYG
jgi:hypothetical protein